MVGYWWQRQKVPRYMQRRHAQQSYLDCQGWAESPSQRLGSRHYDKLLKLLHQFHTMMSNAIIVDMYEKDRHTHRMTTRFVDVLREIHVERNCH